MASAMLFSERYTRIVELLIRNGAEVNPQNDVGRTALMLLAGSGHNEIVELLVSRGGRYKGARQARKDSRGLCRRC